MGTRDRFDASNDCMLQYQSCSDRHNVRLSVLHVVSRRLDDRGCALGNLYGRPRVRLVRAMALRMASAQGYSCTATLQAATAHLRAASSNRSPSPVLYNGALLLAQRRLERLRPVRTGCLMG
jgi:hypothetical protein